MSGAAAPAGTKEPSFTSRPRERGCRRAFEPSAPSFATRVVQYVLADED